MEGKKAPAFTLCNAEGKKVSLKDFLGKKVVLYFYPKDMTSGCTKEACDFRDSFPAFGKVDSAVIGISADSADLHKRFIQKNGLPFELLSDEKKEVLAKYGVWKEKSMYGKKFMGIERSTFVIDEKGIIRKEFRKVKVQGHIEEVLKILKEIK